ncbi:hypothetical protein [Lactobacillus brevis] [Lactiplantibacillus mudanjiangensis]|uniref:YjdF family protein n=1 Tax=Lactiplantibacillus mudanjiangensis TaxID=1296538 RepID=UPI0010150FEE|nr:YjdF family protein [Lactiplantibacillus mudanjiangensis]VDG19654.1 hypothetical protein [Lactobacillus brevis] [Lactiplantibacillus mudanjiangensis]VDG31100.1 hypothetical protein [Lactobacillus brevis] [Lactiplantibacillus mudanjiangensis]
MTIHCQLTVFFDQGFYRGLFERRTSAGYQVARVTLGTQPPTMPQIWWLINQRWTILHWSALMPETQPSPVNQRQRQARRSTKQGGRQSATKLLKLQHQQNLVLKKQRRRQSRLQHAAEVRQKKQAKRLAKHRGH